MPSGRSNLENLARAKQLNAEAPDEPELANLISRAETFLRDARNAGNSVESRLALAYNAAHALALAALRSAGYRPSSAGHRRIVFQVLEFTADAPKALSLALAMTDLVKLATELQSLLLKRLKK